MFGKIITFVVSMFIFCVLGLVALSYSSHVRMMSKVDDIIASTAESVSTMGVMSANAYDYLSESIDRYSIGKTGEQYFIQLKLEKEIKPSVYDTFFESSDDRLGHTLREGKIVGRPLDIGDRLTIYVEDRTPTMFGKISTFPILGMLPYGKERHIKVTKTAVIAKRMTNAVKGYDVITDLNSNPYATIKKIIVITKMNLSGKIYSVPANLPSYKPYGITDASNIDYVFPEGEFLRDEDIINGEKIVRYIQKY